MAYENRFQQSENTLKKAEQKMDSLSRKLKQLLKTLDPTALKDFSTRAQDLQQLKLLRKEANDWLRVLKSQLSGGLKQYVPSRRERNKNTSVHGRYGAMKGPNLKLQKKIRGLIAHLNTLIGLIESGNKNETGILVKSSAEAMDNLMDHGHMKENIGFGDVLPLVVALVALISRFRKKKD